MMKKLLFFVTILSVMMGCKKQSYVAKFDKLPQERAAEQIALVNSTLAGAPNGWVATLPTFAGGGYGFYMTFDGNQNVTMLGDLTDPTSETIGSSYYRVKQDLGTELVFDTYNYISILNDPNSTLGGTGTSKVGFSSDIEFTFDKISADTMFLVGKKYRQPLKLVKATAAQKAIYVAGGYKTAINKFKTFFATTLNPYIEVVSGTVTTKVGITVNSTNTLATGKRITFTSSGAENFIAEGSAAKFAFTTDGISILSPGLITKGLTFNRMAWKDATTLAVYDSTGKEYIVKSSATTVFYTRATVADAATGPGWGADFIARRAQANASTLAGPNGIRIARFTFTFTPSSKTMSLAVGIYIGATQYGDGVFPYTYFKNADGTYRFSTAGAPTGNGSFITNELAPVTTQRLNIDSFKVSYYTDPANPTVVQALFTSVEHPTFAFTAALQ